MFTQNEQTSRIEINSKKILLSKLKPAAPSMKLSSYDTRSYIFQSVICVV